MIQRILAALVLALPLLGCDSSDKSLRSGIFAISGTYDTTPLTVAMTARTDRAVAVAVSDLRPYVIDGGEPEAFLGTERGTWGGEKPMLTASDEPVARVIASAVADGLRRRGTEVVLLPLKPGATDADALAALQAQGGERLLLVRMGEWRTDVYTRVQLKWHLEAAVYGRDGIPLAQRRSLGEAPVANTRLETDYGPMAMNELSQRLTNLLSDPAIGDALK